VHLLGGYQTRSMDSTLSSISSISKLG